MLLLWRRSVSCPPAALLLCLMVFLLVMTKQVKDLYEKNQKNKRIQSYNEFLSEVSDSMADLESTLNKTSLALHQLGTILHAQNIVKKENKYLKIP